MRSTGGYEVEAASDAPSRARVAGHAPLGEVLLARGRIDAADLERALKKQDIQEDHRLLGEILVDLGLVTEIEVAEAIAVGCGIPCVRDRVIAKCSGGKARYTGEE